MDMRDVILKPGNQIRQSLTVNKVIKASGTFDGVIVAGMGGSGHPGDLLNALHLSSVPLTVHRDYDLPATVYAKNPLVVISTYSGNTEESLSAYTAAKKAGWQLLANTSGGKLAEWSATDNVPLVKIDFPGMQPRHTLFASFTGLAVALANTGVAKNITADLERVADVLDAKVAGQEAEAKALAEKLKGVTPVYMSGANLSFAAKNFKIQTNENVKVPGFWSELPEMNHNEMVGMSHLRQAFGGQGHQRFHGVFLRDEADHPRTAARIDVTTELYKSWGVDVTHVHIDGETQLEKIFMAVSFGMWTTYHLANLYGIDPVPVEGVENFKTKLVELAGPA